MGDSEPALEHDGGYTGFRRAGQPDVQFMAVHLHQRPRRGGLAGARSDKSEECKGPDQRSTNEFHRRYLSSLTNGWPRSRVDGFELMLQLHGLALPSPPDDYQRHAGRADE